jgi:5-methylcytosine-specific restriction protein A
MANFYKRGKWKHKRERILRRDEYLCQECRRYGRTTSATTVHHVVPIGVRPELALFSRNLISLCEGCHNAMHDRDTGALTEKGRSWVVRMAPLSSICK